MWISVCALHGTILTVSCYSQCVCVCVCVFMCVEGVGILSGKYRPLQAMGFCWESWEHEKEYKMLSTTVQGTTSYLLSDIMSIKCVKKKFRTESYCYSCPFIHCVTNDLYACNILWLYSENVFLFVQNVFHNITAMSDYRCWLKLWYFPVNVSDL